MHWYITIEKNFWSFILTTLLIFNAIHVALAVEYDPSEAKLKVIKLTDNIYKLQCISGTYTNTLVSAGRDAILLVDTGYPQTADLLKREIKKLESGDVRIVVNTHEHDDHISGNNEFVGSAVIVAHERVKKMYGGPYFALEAVDRSGVPNVVLHNKLTIFFNDEEIKLKHYPGGHTLGDVVVHFPKAKIAFVGDMVFADCFPNADISRGGDLNLCLNNVQEIIDDYPQDTTIVCGHGPDYTTEDLKTYLDVGIKTRRLIEEEIRRGRSVEEILDSHLLDDWKKWGEGVVSNEEWITCVSQQYLKDNNKLKTSVCKPLTEALKENGIDAAIQLYQKLRANERDNYDFAENQLNVFGYQLMSRNLYKEAIKIFTLNVDTYPESGNVYDSLAEAYMNDGNKELAIRFYLKSLETDPSNTNARSMLTRLGHK